MVNNLRNQKKLMNKNSRDFSLEKAAIDYINVLFKDNADGHGVDHTMRVFNLALEIAKDYPESNLFLISMSALLHDVDDHKLFQTENNQHAREFLKTHNVDEEIIEKVCQIIDEISFSHNQNNKPSSLAAMIVQDADRLDAMGAIGVARTFAYGGKNNRPLSSSIQHFHDKLLLLKDMMNTETGKKMAEDRHQFLLNFLKEYEKETKED